ncbi:MAG: nucleoside hydrolase [Chloroflexi bacterium]|nr:nucleoside hydrolase [Chloroflexota bacterium]
MTEQIIFDCDNTMGLPRKEIDDGLTLLYLLGRPDVELVGITTTFGNGTIDEVHPATEQLLRDIGRANIPLHQGEGERGQLPTDAARFLAETAASRPGEITLLATGPLGNLRAAAELDSAFFSNLKQIACMGGYLHPLHIGWRNLAELNLSADPEGSFAVLNAACPVTLMNAHICLQAPFGWRDLRRARFWSRDMRRVARNWLLAFGIYCGVPVFYLWDLLPAVYLSHPELFDENPVWACSTVADLETGTLVAGSKEEGARINMPSRILDPKRFKAILFEAWRQTKNSNAPS